MKTIFSVRKGEKTYYFAANFTASVVRMEKQYNCSLCPTGMSDDNWARSYFQSQNIKVYDLKGIRKELADMAR